MTFSLYPQAEDDQTQDNNNLDINYNNVADEQINSVDYKDTARLESTLTKTYTSFLIKHKFLFYAGYLSGLGTVSSFLVYLSIPVIFTTTIVNIIAAGSLGYALGGFRLEGAKLSIVNGSTIAIGASAASGAYYLSTLFKSEQDNNNKAASIGKERFYSEVKAYEVKTQPNEKVNMNTVSLVLAGAIAAAFIITGVKKYVFKK